MAEIGRFKYRSGGTVVISTDAVIWNDKNSVTRVPIEHISSVDVRLYDDGTLRLRSSWLCVIWRHNRTYEWTRFKDKEDAQAMAAAVRRAMGL